jgi:tetratricopeptide (TPR) repeat protein
MANGPGHPMAPRGGVGRGDDALSRAMFALNSQRPNEAERIAGEVLKADPHHARALHIFGCALLMQGRARDAIAPLETAARGRRDPEIDTQLAVALRQTGRHDDALSRLKRATKRQPPYAVAFCELGSLLVEMERYDEAIEALGRGLEVAPMISDLSIQLGYIFLSRRNCADARVAFARALDISPGSFAALYGMAKAHQEVGECQTAAEYFRRCLTIRPDDAGLWLNLGQCLLEFGQRDAGYECFRTAASDDSKRYGNALASLVRSGRGRFWLKPSAAERYLQGTKI